jgi:hypothetical protein
MATLDKLVQSTGGSIRRPRSPLEAFSPMPEMPETAEAQALMERLA